MKKPKPAMRLRSNNVRYVTVPIEWLLTKNTDKDARSAKLTNDKESAK